MREANTQRESAAMVSQSSARIIAMSQHEESLVLPNDEHNQRLVENSIRPIG